MLYDGSRMVKFLWILFYTLTFCFSWGYTQEWEGFTLAFRSPQLEIYEDSPSPYSSLLQEKHLSLFQEIESVLELSIPTPVFLYFCSQDRVFQNILGKKLEWASGVALLQQRRIVLRTNKALPVHNPWQATLKHELVHLVLGAYEQEVAKTLPWWFHEGLAEALSGQGHLDTPAMDISLQSYRHQLPPLSELDKGLRNRTSTQQIALDYALSRSFCAYLEQNYGTAIYRKILQAFRYPPLSFREAISFATQRPFSQLENEWKSSLEKTFSWFIFFMKHLGICGVFPFLCCWAYHRSQKKRKHQFEAWEKEEKELPTPLEIEYPQL